MKRQRQNIPLTSAEMAKLWTSYMFESMIHHILQCFLHQVEDPDVKSYLTFCHTSASKKHVERLTSIFQKENIPVPRGITSEDINPHAPRLFSDVFYMRYIKNMARFSLTLHANAYTESYRGDIKQLFKDIMNTIQTVDQRGTEIMLSKGILIRPPHIPTPTTVDFVKEQGFLSGFFGDQRPLSALEIDQLFFTALSNALGKSVMMGFSQVTKSKEIRQYFVRGKEMSTKYFRRFSDVLVEEDVTAPPSFDGEVMNPTESPFSDRLMLLHSSVLAASGMGNYGVALAQCQRRDLATLFARVLTEAGVYAEDGANLLIKNGWLEQPPLAPDRSHHSVRT